MGVCLEFEWLLFGCFLDDGIFDKMYYQNEVFLFDFQIFFFFVEMKRRKQFDEGIEENKIINIVFIGFIFIFCWCSFNGFG